MRVCLGLQHIVKLVAKFLHLLLLRQKNRYPELGMTPRSALHVCDCYLMCLLPYDQDYLPFACGFGPIDVIPMPETDLDLSAVWLLYSPGVDL